MFSYTYVVRAAFHDYLHLSFALEMLCAACAVMTVEQFNKLPTSTNAVEAYNRLSKGPSQDSLEVAMMATYKADMAAALRHIAHTKGITVSYESLSPTSRKKRTQTANKGRAKRRAREDDGEGPPDKRRHLEGTFLKGKTYNKYILALFLIPTKVKRR